MGWSAVGQEAGRIIAPRGADRARGRAAQCPLHEQPERAKGEQQMRGKLGAADLGESGGGGAALTGSQLMECATGGMTGIRGSGCLIAQITEGRTKGWGGDCFNLRSSYEVRAGQGHEQQMDVLPGSCEVTRPPLLKQLLHHAKANLFAPREENYCLCSDEIDCRTERQFR
ncbi:unnamed protein product [Calypogeia fissa]